MKTLSEEKVNGTDRKFTGVNFDIKNNKYKARIFHLGKRINLGSFTTFEDAVRARQDAEKQYDIVEKYKGTTGSELPVVHYLLQEVVGVKPTDLGYIEMCIKAENFVFKSSVMYRGDMSFFRFVVEKFGKGEVLRTERKDEKFDFSIFPHWFISWLGCEDSLNAIAKKHQIPSSTLRSEWEKLKNSVC
jgi:hypothetical protein